MSLALLTCFSINQSIVARSNKGPSDNLLFSLQRETDFLKFD